MKPTNREMGSLLDAVALLHAHPDNVHERILQATREALPAEWYALDSFHPHGYWLNQNWQMPDNSATPGEVESFGRHAHEHPLFKAFVETGLPQPRKTTDFITARQFHRLAIYNEFFRPVGTDRQLLIGLAVSSTLTLVLSLNRKRRDFTERSRLLLTLLGPHLITAYQNAEALKRQQLQSTQLEVALEESGCGAILIDEFGQVRSVTAQARVWLAKYFAAAHGGASDLPEDLTNWLAHQVVSSACRGAYSSPVPPLVVTRGAGRLQVRFLKDHAAGNSLLLMEEDVEISTKDLEALGLTRREAEVLSWIAQGKTNSDISVLCGISERTAHKHLEHIYQKLGVETRTAAARRALTAKKQSLAHVNRPV